MPKFYKYNRINDDSFENLRQSKWKASSVDTFNPLTGVIFGCRTEEEDINKVMQAIPDETVSFYKAKLSETDYSIDIVPII